MIFFSLTNKVGVYDTVCSPHRNLMNVRLNSFQRLLISCMLSWFGHSYVSGCSIHCTGIHYGIDTSKLHHEIC